MSNNMTDILKNFAHADSGTGKVIDAETGKTKVSSAAVEKNAMKTLLEGLDTQQRSVNQMPAPHKMANATGTKHPANKFLVGGEEGEAEAGQEVVAEGPLMFAVGDKVTPSWDTTDGEPFEVIDVNGTTVTVKDDAGNTGEMDASQLVKEVVAEVEDDTTDNTGRTASDRQDDRFFLTKKKSDMKDKVPSKKLRSIRVTFDGGKTIETNIAAGVSDARIREYYGYGKEFNLGNDEGEDVQMVTSVEILEGSVEEDTISARKPSTEVHKKQSLSDLFRSMEETNLSKEDQYKKELQGQRKKRELTKSSNGKFNLGEEDYDDETEEQAANKFSNGMQVELVGRYVETPGEQYTLSNWNGRQGWIGDKDGRGWTVRGAQITPVETRDDEEPVDEGEVSDEPTNLTWGDELIEDLKLLVAEVSQLDGVIDTQQILELIQKYEI